jgi:LysM repeat protein
MKILIVAFIFAANQVNAQNDIYIKYDVAYMDKYQYKVENLSSQNFHIAFHIYTSANERIILNTSMNSYEELDDPLAKKAVALTQVDWSSALINEINNGLSSVYLVFKGDDERYVKYQVSTVVFVEETDDKLMYSGPYYSCTFDKKKNYGVAEDLASGVYDTYDETIFMTNNGNSTMNCLNQYGFIKIIKEVHPKGSFTMIANDDFTNLRQNEVDEICQSALYVDFVENIGIIEERTKNGRITLIGINDKPIEKYINEKCQNSTDIPTEYETRTSSSTASVQPVGNSGLNFSTRGDDNTTKSGTVTGNTSTVVMNPTTTNNATTSYGGEGAYELVLQMFGSQNNTGIENTQKSPTMNAKDHIVDNGETLYSISKKYGMSIRELQELNNLETIDIFVTQILIISEDNEFQD